MQDLPPTWPLDQFYATATELHILCKSGPAPNPAAEPNVIFIKLGPAPLPMSNGCGRNSAQ